MELISNNVFLLLLAFSSLFSSTIAICVPRNYSDIEYAVPTAALLPPIVPPQISPQSSPVTDSPPPQSPSPQTPPVTETESSSEPPVTDSESSAAPTDSESSSAPTDSESSSAPTDSAPAEEEKSGSEEESGAPVAEKSHSDDLVSSIASSVTTNLVEICDVTSNPELCKTSISSQIGGNTVDPASALKTEIEESIKEVTKAIATLKSLRKDSAATKAEIGCYDTCLENFDMAIEDLKAGMESIDSHDVGRMESVLTAVMTDLTTCEDTFAEMGVDSPLDNLSAKMNKFASNCLAISKLLL